MVLADGGDSADAPVASAPEAATARPSRGARATTPATPPTPGVAAIPARLPGVAVAPVPIGSARESLVFRTRNTILNGLEGASSEYALEIAEARTGGETGLLIGVAAVPGARPPHVARNVNRLIALDPEAAYRASGRPVTVYRAPGYHLAVVDGGPRRALVVIAQGKPRTRAMAEAVARAISDPSG